MNFRRPFYDDVLNRLVHKKITQTLMDTRVLSDSVRVRFLTKPKLKFYKILMKLLKFDQSITSFKFFSDRAHK